MLSQVQIDQLSAPLSRDVVKMREQGGSKFSYVEGWHVIAEANRIFGFGAWTSITSEVRCVAEVERTVGSKALPGWGVTYIAKVVIILPGENISRDGWGAGHGIDVNRGLAHESAVKEAETDARKRALMTFGNPFGLALYDKTHANVANPVDEMEASRRRFIEECKVKIASYPPEHHELLLGWWHSDQQRAARRDFDLSPPEVIELKGLITARLPKKTA
jgi:DNA repair and recombination protein RAD52